MDSEDDEKEAPALVSIDAEDEDEEVTFFPVDKMLHEHVHRFLEVGEEYSWMDLPGNRLIVFFRSIFSPVHHSPGPWVWVKPGKN